MNIAHDTAATVLQEVHMMKLSEHRLDPQKGANYGAESSVNVVKKLHSLGQHKVAAMFLTHKGVNM